MKASLDVDMTPFSNAVRNLIASTNGEALGKAVLAGLFTLEAYAKLNVRANFEQQTGHLASAWETKLDEVKANNASGHTAPLAIYARIQELGGVIRATNAEALVFEIDGQLIRVKAVTIPARPYLRPAADTNQEEIINAVVVTLRGAINNAG